MERFLNKVICGDSLEIMKKLPDKCIDLVLTDPPYGIGADKGVGGGSKRGEVKKFDGNWDNFIPDKEYFDEMKRISKNQIIFGGNYFIEHLDNSPHYIIWDKREGLPERTFADCEMAWSSFKSPARIFRFKWDGMIQENMKDKQEKYHPTQKPVQLFEWIIRKYTDETAIILDCFSGSCTTAIAAIQAKRGFICIGKEEQYAKIGQERVDYALRKQPLF